MCRKGRERTGQEGVMGGEGACVRKDVEEPDRGSNREHSVRKV